MGPCVLKVTSHGEDEAQVPASFGEASHPSGIPESLSHRQRMSLGQADGRGDR